MPDLLHHDHRHQQPDRADRRHPHRGLQELLDGGLPKWVREGRPTETGDAPAPPPAAFVPDLRAERLKGIGDVKRIVRQGGTKGSGLALILDARARGRFDGSAPEPRPGLPGGHMPGAANLPSSELLNPDGTVSGRFYDSEIEAGRWKLDRGRLCASFRTSDGVGPYHTAVCANGADAVGQTWAEHRDFLFNWNATRSPDSP